MKPRTEIIGNRIVNSVEQLASFLKPGDIFRKPHGKTQYKFDELRLSERLVICENLDTMAPEQIYYNSPVFKLVGI
jgi:hypothetical protein